MPSIAQRFYDIKTKIGGNREKRNWEYTFGMPQETIFQVTMPNRYNRRVMSQLEFALKLNEANSGKFDSVVKEALSLLEESMESDGVLTRNICEKAEQILLPMEQAAKEYELILAAHAHLDMNWMWGWQETVAATLSTFRTMLHLMREYPDFTYSQSQASVYKIVEDYDPAMMAEIKERVKEGRWECTATAWVETDKNMPNTESLLRHIKYTRDYMQEVWEIDPKALEIDFSPDTFGHSPHVPEIDYFGNVKYYYHCRGHNKRHVLYRWVAPSGKEVITYNEPYWYNSAIVPEIAMPLIELSGLCGGLKTGLIVYGVGNHGGGPTRRDVERAIEMQGWLVYPKVKFGTFREFFKKAEAVRDKLPVWEGEINFFATGCYTTQSRIKLGNRKSEAALLDAEGIYALSNIKTGFKYPGDKLRRAWQNVLLTHFHDIITGSNTPDSKEHAMGLYADSMSVANTLRENSARALSNSIDTSMIEVDTDIADTQSEGAGVGYGVEQFSGVPNPETGKGKVRIYHVFNPSAHERTDTAEITVWDWIGDFKRLSVCDHEGNKLPFQLVDNTYQRYWDHQYFRLLVELKVPAMGYVTVVVKESPLESYPVLTHGFPRADNPHNPIILENDYLKACFSHADGALLSLTDKKTGKEQIKPEAGGGRLMLVNAERRSNSAWQIGRHLGYVPVTKTINLRQTQSGSLRSAFVMEQEILSSIITTTVSLDRDSKALHYSLEVKWHEYTKREENVPVLSFAIPLSDTPEAYQTDTAAGYIKRQAMFQDVSGHQYAAALYANNRALAIMSDGKYGYRGGGFGEHSDVLSHTLLNSSGNPDPYPEVGAHKINFWVAVEDACPKALQVTAGEFCHPLSHISASSHKGDLPPAASLLQVDSATSIYSSAGLTEDGALLVRVYETCGADDNITITLPFTPKSAEIINLCGEVSGSADISGAKVNFKLNKNSISAVKISR